jgi:hypothetical protein
VDRRWAARTASPNRPRSYQYLFDVDVELAEQLDIRMRLAARSSVTAITFETPPGQLPLAEWLALACTGPGLLVLDGVVVADVQVGDRITAELIGAGDLIQPWSYDDAELDCEVGWRALRSTRFAVLDSAFAQRVQPWPQITDALLQRVGKRTRRLNVQRAIAAQPRLEVRLALLMWHLAARWGKVEPGGVRLPLPLTHQLLGRLISAERPSVSHALARLAHAGLLIGQGDDWHLYGSVEGHLATMIEPPVSRVQQLVQPVASPASRR